MQTSSIQTKIKRSLYNQGFGLVELLVSISIMVIVISVVISRNTAFNGASLLRGQAYDLALNVREMQLLAVSATNDKTGGTYRNVYGLVFDKSKPNMYTIFRDDDGDFKLDTDEVFGKQGVIDGRYQIDDIRYIDGSANSSENDVTILFKRPNFDSLLFHNGSDVGGSVYGIEIDIRLKGTSGSGPGEIRTIEITRAGQITVK